MFFLKAGTALRRLKIGKVTTNSRKVGANLFKKKSKTEKKREYNLMRKIFIILSRRPFFSSTVILYS